VAASECIRCLDPDLLRGLGDECPQVVERVDVVDVEPICGSLMVTSMPW
jgi:hypothetical protein